MSKQEVIPFSFFAGSKLFVFVIVFIQTAECKENNIPLFILEGCTWRLKREKGSMSKKEIYYVYIQQLGIYEQLQKHLTGTPRQIQLFNFIYLFIYLFFIVTHTFQFLPWVMRIGCLTANVTNMVIGVQLPSLSI